MECQPSDSKKIFKVFDASKRKRTRKKHDGEDSNSVATEDSAGGCQGTGRRVSSAKASLQGISSLQNVNGIQDNLAKRDRGSSPSISRSPVDTHRRRSPRRHRRIARDGMSLALKAGLTSTPRSTSPNPQKDNAIDSIPREQDSFIYAFLEEAIKKDKKHRQTKRHEGRAAGREHEEHAVRERHHHHRRHRDEHRDRDKSVKEDQAPPVDQVALFETFAKLCAQMNEKCTRPNIYQVPRSQSHKSLQCEDVSRRESYVVGQRPERLPSRECSRDNLSPSRIRSHDHFQNRIRSSDNIATPRDDRNDKCGCCDSYQKQQQRYSSKINVMQDKQYYDDRYPDYPPVPTQTRSNINGNYRTRATDRRDIRDCEEQRPKHEDKRRLCEQKASRSFDAHRDEYNDERKYRRTARSDEIKDKRYDDRDYRDRRYEERSRDKYYEEKEIRQKNFATLSTKDRRSRRNLERFDKISIASRDEDYRDRDRDKYSERERYSGQSAVCDGENSTVSGKSNYLKVVKQEISEQREAMDKMMKLWKELMRCFKGISQTQTGTDKSNDTVANTVRESAAEQLRLWRECMRRYETVARDVGDTDARLMEEINKQRSEMAEMATMWQECLQRYRDMSNDFNTLKQQLATSESPSRAAAPAPVACAEGEGPPVAPYRVPQNYPPVPPIPPGYLGGSPLRSRASAPPAWWWGGEDHPPPRRRSSPDSQKSRDRDRRHRHKDRDRDDTRYKEKSKPSGARSEHRHRKR